MAAGMTPAAGIAHLVEKADACRGILSPGLDILSSSFGGR